MTLRRKLKKKTGKIVIVLALSILLIVHMLPVAIMLLNSLRSTEAIQKTLIRFPEAASFDNFIKAWTQGDYLQAYLNNIIIGGCAAVVVMLFTALAAYGVTKLNIFGKSFFEGYFMVAISIPAFAVMVPLYYIFYNLNLVNNYLGIILIFCASNIPFCFMFVKAFFVGISKEIEEAAKIDGCNEVRSFVYVIAPNAKPIFLTVLLIVFVNVWNEFMFSNTFLQSEEIRTVALRFYRFVSKFSMDLGMVFAAGCISIVPIIVVYLLLQNMFIEGFTSGSVKG